MKHPVIILAASAAISLVLLAVAASAHAQDAHQSWTYKSNKKGGPGGHHDTENFVAGTLSVEQKGEQAYFRMPAGWIDVRYRGVLPAAVTRTDALTTIEVTQPVPGCEDFRYTIRNDGSGGFKETRAGDAWRMTSFDHGPTPVK